MSLSVPPHPHPNTHTLAHTQACHAHIRGILDSMCNDTVRTWSGARGEEGAAEPQEGFGMGNAESF